MSAQLLSCIPFGRFFLKAHFLSTLNTFIMSYKNNGSNAGVIKSLFYVTSLIKSLFFVLPA
jgi:hypothetical protein